MPYFILRAHDGRTWQTSRGFIGTTIAEATKYSDQTEATNVRDFCCPVKARAVVEEVKDRE
jgi:hypothetical protein